MIAELTNDHVNPAIRDLYNQIYKNGLPTLFNYNEPAKTILIPEAVGKTEHKNERQLLFELASCSIDSEQESNQSYNKS